MNREPDLTAAPHLRIELVCGHAHGRGTERTHRACLRTLADFSRTLGDTTAWDGPAKSEKPQVEGHFRGWS